MAHRRSIAVRVAAVAMVMSAAPLAGGQPRDMFVVAHQDDDLFFMNPDVYRSIQLGHDVAVVYITAGNRSDLPASYWMEREKGVLNAYTYMARKAGKVLETTSVATRPADLECQQTGSSLGAWSLVPDPVITTSTNNAIGYVHYGLAGAGIIHLIFLRFTDDDGLPGSPVPLQQLWEDSSSTVRLFTVASDTGVCNQPCTWTCSGAPGGAQTCTGALNCALGAALPVRYAYSRQDMIDVLATLMARFSVTTVHAMDSTGIHVNSCGFDASTTPVPNYRIDNCSHVYAGLFAFAAHQLYAAPHSIAIYRGYDMNIEAPNLSDAEAAEKRTTVSHYNIADQRWCTDALTCGTPLNPYLYSEYQIYWPQRKYVIREVREWSSPSMTGPLASDHVGATLTCLSASASAAAGAPCESAPGVVPLKNLWTLDVRGFLKNDGRCLRVAADGAGVLMATCPAEPTPSTRWSLFTNGQLRSGADGRCLAFDGASASVGLAACADVSEQRWTLQFGGSTQWSVGSDFTDDSIPAVTSDGSYRTFNLVQLDAGGLADLCMRRSDGVWCARNTGSGAFASWALSLQTGWSDIAGWGLSWYGSTLMFGLLNATDAHACVCGRGSAGVYCGGMRSPGTAYMSNEFSDGRGWADASAYYGSIRLGDIDGDGHTDLCGRGQGGVLCSRRESGANFDNLATLWTSEFSDAKGWLAERYGTTLMIGDVDGDGFADVCGRGRDGITCAVSRPAERAFVNSHVWSYRTPVASSSLLTYPTGDFDDASNWGSDPSYYRSLRLVDINGDGRADICGRSANGLVCGYSTGTSFSPVRPVMNREFTDSKNWNTDKYGSSITFGRLFGDRSIGVCGRGVAVYCSAIRAQ